MKVKHLVKKKPKLVQLEKRQNVKVAESYLGRNHGPRPHPATQEGIYYSQCACRE